MASVAQPVRRRPKDRKKQILDQAVGLFIERGFHSVKLEDIAEAAGVTARALYRHYDNKQALLAEAIRTGQDQYQSARRLTEGETEPTPRPLNADLEDLIAAAVASRALTVLWQREARYLNEDDRTAVRRRINAIVAGMRDSVLLEVPDLSPQHSELRAWAVSSTLTSLGRHSLSLPGEELKKLLYQACMAAARTPPVCELPPLPAGDAARDEADVLFSRYETLLAAGARLFRAQGYPAVNTSEIGKEPASRARGCTVRFLPNRPSWTRSSAASTSGAAWSASERYERISKRHNGCAALSKGTFGSAWTLRIWWQCRSPNCRTPLSKYATATCEIRATARPCGSTSSASWYPRPVSPRGDCWSRRRLASSKTSLAPGISRATPESPTRSVAWRWRS